MGFRNIMISSPLNLHIKNKQLVIEADVNKSIPMEDINSILIENTSVQVTAYFLQEASKCGIAVYFCDDKHRPNCICLPMVRHSRHYKMLKNQLALAKPFQKRLWQQIVIQKLLNQSRCLLMNELVGSEKLESFARMVQSGDKTNMEARGAALYFRSVFGKDFSRDAENGINAALNYGYAIIRGIVARSIICYGFEPSIGLFHHSELNSFNLADDLIEPFRPVVDQYVIYKYQNNLLEDDLTPAIKKELYQLVTVDMMSNQERHSVTNAVDRLVMSYSACLSGEMDTLWLPELLPPKSHRYE